MESTTIHNSTMEIYHHYLHRYPKIFKLFLENNTVISPPSYPVEKLFSIGIIVTTAKYFKLSDELFEQLVILKRNKMYLI